MMFNFKNDYNAICHKDIMDAIFQNRNELCVGYGLDEHSSNAMNLIKEAIDCSDAEIHFMVGGTSTNKTLISHILRPYEAVISCDSGHINVHETGAIEATGHKVLTVVADNGKLTVDKLKEIVSSHKDEHMVKPKMVYISNATELGTVYYYDDLKELYDFCRNNELYLFIDGARLGVALTSFLNDVKLSDLPKLCDAFYIGGTKNGAMLGEALVIVNDDLKKDFRYSIKQNGGMYAKGFVIGIQFDTLFTNNLYFDIARKMNDWASLLRMGLTDMEVQFAYQTFTNQLFPIFSKEIVEKLKEVAEFEIWEERGEDIVIRLVTSFLTDEEMIGDFLEQLSLILFNEGDFNE